MSSDLERRVREGLRALPDGDPRARERARERALDALPGAARRRGRRPRWVLALAGAAAAVAVAGVALAATDRLELRIGAEPPPATTPVAAPAPGRLGLPAEAEGLGLVAADRLWLTTARGLGVQGLAASTAELSPRALFAVVGIGDALVALAPGGRRAWSHATGGRVVAAAWAPNPIVIAYLVRRGDRHALHVIEGDGANDRLADPDVAPVRPSWRADTLAIAYARRDGSVRTVSYPSLAPAGTVPAVGGPVTHLAFAPAGDRVAVAYGGPVARVRVVRPGEAAPFATSPGFAVRAAIHGLVWTGPDALVAGGAEPRGGGRVWTLPVGDAVASKAIATAAGPPVRGLAAAGRRLVVAVREAGELRLWDVAPARVGATALAPRRVLLRIPAPPSGARVTLSLR